MPVLPMDSVGKGPPYVLGIATVRGAPAPVIDLGALISETKTLDVGRFVTLRVASRLAVLAVTDVVSVRALDDSTLHPLPPIIGGASAEVIESLGRLDAELLVVLRASRLVPEAVWESLAIDARGVS